ncbi:ABC transporter permease [Bacillus anthracis]|uniref:ABC transporter permease n=1 Tax=Bacillus TaxID=1386 RepID=UPI002377EA7F|nr:MULTISPECIES: ABC transporter permease [Bacillus]MCU5531597.1 ABC transporter permease [Bacillus cereus]MDA2617795.1 ABC transporter permease [Bacillus cereus]MEB9504378.1 ABC transporter permease [Bacillus anthracis]WDL92143.1 ABC transporter permease [Bacillus sp. HNR-4]
MTFSMRRFSAIFRKEVQDIKTNASVLVMAAMPIMFAFVYQQMDGPKEQIANMVTLMSLIMVGSFVQAALIAEEKEKHTLRVMMLSPTSSLEVLLGKSALTGLITFVICISNFAILGVVKGNMVLIILFLLISIFFFLMLGTAIGLLAKTMASTSVVGMPILFVFFLAPMLGEFIKNKFVTKAIEFLPTKHLADAMPKMLAGKGFSTVSGDLINIIIWSVLSIVLCIVVYKKKQMD